jgi:cell division protein FtsI/penicillin-binding protein 2
MTTIVLLRVAAFLLCLVAAFSLIQFAKSALAIPKHNQWHKAGQYGMNRLLPNEPDRDTDWDYVDQRGWRDLAGAKMWGGVAVLSGIGVLVLLFMVS